MSNTKKLVVWSHKRSSSAHTDRYRRAALSELSGCTSVFSPLTPAQTGVCSGRHGAVKLKTNKGPSWAGNVMPIAYCNVVSNYWSVRKNVIHY